MYDDLPTIEHTVDAHGFVLVDGKRVLHVPGANLKHTPSFVARCQYCLNAVTLPLRVVSEFEHAIGARRYFHAPVPGETLTHETCRRQADDHA